MLLHCRLPRHRIAKHFSSLNTRYQHCKTFAMDARISQAPSEKLKSEFKDMIAASPQIILGTQSSSRRAIMDELAQEYGFQYTCQVAGIDEEAIRHPEPPHLVLMLARAKAEAILAKLAASGMDTHSDQSRRTYLITCDQVVLYDGHIREKPIDARQAKEWIHSYAALPACTCGSTRVVNIGTGKAAETVDLAECHFGPIPEATIDKLIEQGEVMWCSGGLMVEHPDVVPHLQRMVGTQDSVMGLSKQAVMEMLVQIINMLGAAMRQDPTIRSAAEQQLQQARYLEGFGAALTKVVVTESSSVPTDIRQMGAIVLKQYIRERWVGHTNGATQCATSESEKQLMRNMLPRGLLHSERKVRTAVGMAIAEIAKHELPAGWPDLVPQLVSAITQGRDVHAMEGSLRCLSLFVDELEEQQIIQLCTTLLPPLVELVAPPAANTTHHIPPLKLQRKAFTMLRSILVASEHMEPEHKELMGALWSNYLPVVMRTLQQRIASPLVVGNPDDYGIKLQCLAIVMRLITELQPVLVEPYAEGLMGAVWHLLQHILPVIMENEILVSEEDAIAAAAADDDDGELLTLEAIVSQLFELLLLFVSSETYRPLLVAVLQPLLYHSLAFMCMTANQEQLWSTDVNQFIADAEDDMSSARVSAELLLDELVMACEADALVALSHALQQRLQDAATAKAAGNEFWWKTREACVECLGVLSDILCEAAEDGEELPLDGRGLLMMFLRDDLAHGDSCPLLAARVLWVAGRLLPVLPEQALPHLAAAATTNLAPDRALCVRIGACKTIDALAQTHPHVLQPHIGLIYSGIGSLLDTSGEEVVHLALEVLPDLISADPNTATAMCPHVAPRVLSLWTQWLQDPLLGESCFDVLESLAKMPTCGGQLEALFLQHVLPLLDNHTAAQHNTDAAAQLSNAISLLTLLLKHADGHMVQRVGVMLLPRLLVVGETCTDPQVGQEVTEALRALLWSGKRDLLVYEGFPGAQLPTQLMGVCTRLLHLPDNSSAFVWKLLLQLLATMPQEVTPQLEVVGEAASQQLQQGSPIMQQGLVCFFAMLLLMHPDHGLSFLHERVVPGSSTTLLELVLQTWVTRQAEFSRPQELKLTCCALGVLLSVSHPALDSMMTRGVRLDSPGGGRVKTRRQAAAAAPPQFSSVTMRTKLLMLIADVLVHAAADDQAPSGSEEEEEDPYGLHRTPRPGSLDITGYETDTHTRGAAAAQGGEDIFSIGIPDVAPGKTIRQCITGAMQQLAAQQRGVLIAAGQHLSTMQQQALERAIGA